MMKTPFVLVLLWMWVSLVSCEDVAVLVNWETTLGVSSTYTTLQCVTNPLYERTSPIYYQTFAALANLGVDYVRFQGWDPYPQLVVAELQPPTGNPVCVTAAANLTVYLQCYQGTIESIKFAAYGDPEGRCESFKEGTCNAPNTLQLVEKMCVGHSFCQLNTTELFDARPCPHVPNVRLAVEATCSSSVNRTFWNFTYMDAFVEDFMQAQGNHSVIMNFCVSPQWLWNTPEPVYYPSDPNIPMWNYSSGTDLRDPTMQDIVNYYKRLLQWYTQGGFYDEYGVHHKSDYHYTFQRWEIFNEMDLGGHGGNWAWESYTRLYDAISMGIKEVDPKIEIVGLALGSPTTSIPTAYQWVSYFLNYSNHHPNVSLEWISYHFYALPTSRNDTYIFQTFFDQADVFLGEVVQIQVYRELLAPWVKTTIDELGVILPNDNDENPGPIPNLYWNAAGAMYAYIFGHLTELGVEVLGMSQMIGYPSQYPSVSMMDWSTGKPNSRYWVLSLLHNSFQVGDTIVQAFTSNSTSLYAKGFISAETHQRSILIVNKSNQAMNVTISGMKRGQMTYVDVTTYEGPPASLSLSSLPFVFNAFAVGVVDVLV